MAKNTWKNDKEKKRIKPSPLRGIRVPEVCSPKETTKDTNWMEGGFLLRFKTLYMEYSL
jgi:hypothetical protein